MMPRNEDRSLNCTSKIHAYNTWEIDLSLISEVIWNEDASKR